MGMTRFILVLPLVAVLAATGCINVNVRLGDDTGGPVTLWNLDYARPDATPLKFNRVIRVRDFSSAGVYEMNNMILRLADGTMVESTLDRWSSRPSTQVAVLLTRDLVAEDTYDAVFTTTTTVPDRLILDGYVREFGAAEVDSVTWMAVLDIDVSLLGDRCDEVIFQRNYRYESRMPGTGYDVLAHELSMLTEIWSEEVRGDLVSCMLPRR
jgi:ABC-type uncharacterized transport system auxiliary subunit